MQQVNNYVLSLDMKPLILKWKHEYTSRWHVPPSLTINLKCWKDRGLEDHAFFRKKRKLPAASKLSCAHLCNTDDVSRPTLLGQHKAPELVQNWPSCFHIETEYNPELLVILPSSVFQFYCQEQEEHLVRYEKLSEWKNSN